ncbi:hypothetical protein PIB30_021339 [Stylosanthes scabra]|uniref:Uncharacterized protein n=1 Tax=Stylosanthes scabra TaxID=79078 RepID=A0ABU6Q964_9FABA|nr:hypothetical protein [Stylosanthes scabra]
MDILTLPYFCQSKIHSMEELKQSLLYTTLELEQTRAAVQEELKKRDEQLLTLKDLLNKTITERDEANDKCQRLLLEKLLLQQQHNNGAVAAPLSGISSIEDDHRRNINNGHYSSSDCEESIVSSPLMENHLSPQALAAAESAMIEAVTPTGPLPEKGKLLQAVMKAGPLLQTLLLAGPLPQWRHPPPPLESFEIPPVTIPSPPPPPSNSTRKREFSDASGGSESSPIETNKYQRVALH